MTVRESSDSQNCSLARTLNRQEKREGKIADFEGELATTNQPSIYSQP
jgi:hypothetical protein